MGHTMELRRLRYFVQVALEGSLGKASRALGVAQPALSRQVQMLEADLGVQLFQRGPKGMQLTDEGAYLKEALDHPLKQVDLALRNVRSYSARVETAFTLGLPPPVAQKFGPRLAGRLLTELPNLKLRVVEDHSSRLAADLQRGLVDIAILIGVTPDERVFHTDVLNEPLLLVGAPDSALAGHSTVPFGELHRYPLILPGVQAGLPTKLEKLAANTGAKITIAFEIDSIELTKEMVKAGSGYTILPPIAFKEEAQHHELISARVTNPSLDQLVLYAIQPHWRVARSTYNEVERIIFEVWTMVVETGEWPAEWLFDHQRLSINWPKSRVPRKTLKVI
jgi:LysR family transcriptional regulator, nitrogen assimilation regulatory protein